MAKVYTSKSNAARAAKAQGGEVCKTEHGSWTVRAARGAGDDEKPAKQLRDDSLPEPTGSEPVQLACEDGDLLLCKASRARQEAAALANIEGRTIYARHPVSDALLFSVDPAAPRKSAKKAATVKAAKPAAKAPKTAAPKATTSRAPKAEKPAAKPKVERADRASKDKPAPGSFAERIIAICCRPQGATPQDLNDLTNWKGAPWKWTLSNPKGNGLADRYGYTLRVETNEKRRSTYHLTRNA